VFVYGGGVVAKGAVPLRSKPSEARGLSTGTREYPPVSLAREPSTKVLRSSEDIVVLVLRLFLYRLRLFFYRIA
jgi:hypothetical protein